MALTYANLKDYADHVSGGPLNAIWTDSDTTEGVIVNQAGRFMLDMHPWKWRERQNVPLTVYADDAITDATYTESTLNLAKTAGFTNYTFTPGDTIDLTAGTGATVGTYTIASRTDDDNIVLSSSIGSAADGQTDIDFTIVHDKVALPSDFGEFMGAHPVVATDALTNKVVPGTADEIRELRSNSVVTSGNVYHYCLIYPAQTSTTANAGVPKLQIYPSPASDSTDFFRVSYLAAWTELSADASVADIPQRWESLLLECIKHFVRAHEDEQHDAYHQIYNSKLFEELRKADGRTMSAFGPVSGGIFQKRATASNKPWSTFTDPS